MTEINQELIKQVSELVNLAKDGIIGSAEILQQQAPDLMNQLIAWKIYKSIIDLGVSFFFLISALLIMKNWKKLSKHWWADLSESPLPFFVGLYMFFAITFGAGSCVYNVAQLVYVQVAPKVYLLQVLRDML